MPQREEDFCKRKDERQKEESRERRAERKDTVYFEDLGREWLTAVRFSVKESTYTRYHRIMTHYLAPCFGRLPVVQIDAQRVNQTMRQWLEIGGKKGMPLSAKSVTDILCVLKAVFRYGRENGYSCEPLDAVHFPGKSVRQVKILSERERAAVEKALFASSTLIALGTLLSLYTGLRIGELCGLRWEDIDWENEVMYIRRTVERIADLSSQTTRKTKVILCEPKTPSSVRLIPLPSFLSAYLQEYRSAEDVYVVSGSKRYKEPHQIYMEYKRFLKRKGLGSNTFHTLRHTFATRCIEEGFDVKSLSELLGHASVTTTLSVYVHPSLEQKRKQMERLLPVGG